VQRSGWRLWRDGVCAAEHVQGARATCTQYTEGECWWQGGSRSSMSVWQTERACVAHTAAAAAPRHANSVCWRSRPRDKFVAPTPTLLRGAQWQRQQQAQPLQVDQLVVPSSPPGAATLPLRPCSRDNGVGRRPTQ
jgi:hypothetical protein